jgi:hypothetical protein
MICRLWSCIALINAPGSVPKSVEWNHGVWYVRLYQEVWPVLLNCRLMHRRCCGTSSITPWWRLWQLSVGPSIQVLPTIAFWSNRPFTSVSHASNLCLWDCCWCGSERRILGGAARPRRCGQTWLVRSDLVGVAGPWRCGRSNFFWCLAHGLGPLGYYSKCRVIWQSLVLIEGGW